MKKIPKLQTAFQPLYPQSKWTTEYRQRQKEEDEQYNRDMNSPYFQTHPKPTKSQWKAQRQQVAGRQGTVTKTEDVSAPVRAINNYFRELNYNTQNGIVPRWYHGYPLAMLATGLGQSVVTAPFATTASFIGGYTGGKAIDTGSKLTTGKSWAENVHNLTGLDIEPSEISNPGVWIGGFYVPKYGTNVVRRGVETAMRTSPMQNGLETFIDNGKLVLKDRNRVKAIGKYIFTGKATGNKGYYNSLRYTHPEENYYGGFDWIPENLRGKNDVIDAFLYGKEIDPGFGLYKKAQGENFGIHKNYVGENYSNKADKIQVYGTYKTDPLYSKIKTTHSKGIDSEIETGNNVGFDAAGHRQVYGFDKAGNQYTMEQDIWKFKPKEYMKKWLDNNKDVDVPLWKKALMRSGLEVTDRVGTPVIVRTPWKPTSLGRQKSILHGDLQAPPSQININMDDLLKNIDLNNLIK